MHFNERSAGDPNFLAELEAMKELHLRKSGDYGTREDPLANVRMSEAFGLPSWIGVAIRLQDKMVRIQNAVKQYLDTNQVTMSNESLRDAFSDLSAYGVIGVVEVDRWEENNNG
jgi:hypothetical protein